ncbi:MAG: hypothetical protein IT443_02490, partial [Phycisphaeraceae bacterium]|nr:hypothetical protein [Phycisphaeraceae bacterium]
MGPEHRNWLRQLIASPAVRDLCASLAPGIAPGRADSLSLSEGEGKGEGVGPGVSSIVPSLTAEGSFGSSPNLLAGAIAARLGCPVLLVVAHLDDADDAVGDLELFDAAGFKLNPRRFGALEVLPGESSVSLELLAERLAVVEALTNPKNMGATQHFRGGEACCVPMADSTSPAGDGFLPGAGQASVLVAPIQALMQGVPQPDALADFALNLRAGLAMPPGRLLDWLDRAGYSRVDAIEQPGDFAVRGGIIDIFAPCGVMVETVDRKNAPAKDKLESVGSGEPTPIRLDYFGDDIESITLIDTETMGSGRKIQAAKLIGASARQLQMDDRTTNLITLLPPRTVVVLHEILELSEQARGYYERLTNARGIYSPPAVMKLLTSRPHVQVMQYSSGRLAAPKPLAGSAPLSGAGVLPGVRLPVRSLMSFDRDAAKAVAELKELARTGLDVVVLCQNDAERDRLTELLKDQDAPSPSSSESDVPPFSGRSQIAASGDVRLEIGYLHRGFLWQDAPAPGSALGIAPGTSYSLSLSEGEGK